MSAFTIDTSTETLLANGFTGGIITPPETKIEIALPPSVFMRIDPTVPSIYDFAVDNPQLGDILSTDLRYYTYPKNPPGYQNVMNIGNELFLYLVTTRKSSPDLDTFTMAMGIVQLLRRARLDTLLDTWFMEKTGIAFSSFHLETLSMSHLVGFLACREMGFHEFIELARRSGNPFYINLFSLGIEI